MNDLCCFSAYKTKPIKTKLWYSNMIPVCTHLRTYYACISLFKIRTVGTCRSYPIFVCLSVCLFVYLSVCSFFCLFVCLFLCLGGTETTQYNMSRRMGKPTICIGENKAQISFAVTAKLISVFVFTLRILQSFYFLNPKFEAPSLLLLLYRPVCVGPGRNQNCWFSNAQAHMYVENINDVAL